MNDAERDERMMRQLGIVKPEALEKVPVTIIGAGGIGSFLGQFLARMGVTDLTIWDFDSVETHNLPNQMYPEEALGDPKAKALAREIERIDPNLTVTVHTDEVHADTPLRGLVVCAVDSLEARQEIWQAIRLKVGVQLYIDARMGAEIGHVQVIRPMRPEDLRRYEQSLEGEPVELPCTAKAIVYNGAMISSIVANIVKRHAMGETVPGEVVFSFPDLEAGTGLFVSEA